jgi:hypothetical protein
VVHLYKIREAKVTISVVRAIIRDLPQKDKMVKIWRKKIFIIFVGDGMHMVSVGPKDKVMVVVIVGVIILRRSVINLVANPQQ